MILSAMCEKKNASAVRSIAVKKRKAARVVNPSAEWAVSSIVIQWIASGSDLAKEGLMA